MTVIELPRTMLDRVHARYGAVDNPVGDRSVFRRAAHRLASHPGPRSTPREDALASVDGVDQVRW